MANDSVEPDTFPKLLLRHARQRGDHAAIREKSRGIWRTTTWRGLADDVAALAGALAARGLERGAHVAFVGGNRPRLYAAMCATQWLGGVVVPLFQEAGAEELSPLLQSAEVTHIFAEDQEQVDKLLAVLPRCPSVRCIIYDKDRGLRHYKHPQLVAYADLLHTGREIAVSKAMSCRGSLRVAAARMWRHCFLRQALPAHQGRRFHPRSLINRAQTA